ncbi:SRPBCC family protein [Actinoallomurus iriomotensis]|uniref:Activator of Hsp90 ATPase homologue 1/2-like C-terminal domain-containing protein n=1 Tax=Actinoallomurus iriomotensis TaxID=478107 RepID=A0A9W6VLT5_9ACTN|nr:SRPBCC domain-containing protein [Actinoallomurus iriomotensis]GLY71782.1 hypothetical protein Airi01_000490 [Actinoallomurus iriomotensis]
MTHEFEVRKEITLDATPEQVWDAIATGPGIDSWYMGRNELEPRVGGRGGLTLGGHTEESTVTSWEPGERLAYRTPENPDGTFMAFEYLIEGRDGGGAVLRLVHNGFLGDDWETEYEAMKTGWDMYLAKLAEYLTHFRGRVATPVFAARPQGPAPERLWAVLRKELGLTGDVKEGDRAALTVEGLPPIDGVIDYVDRPHFLGIRTEDAMYRFIHSGADRGNVIVLGHHLFAGTAGQKEAEHAWQGWLDGLTFA